MFWKKKKNIYRMTNCSDRRKEKKIYGQSNQVWKNFYPVQSTEWCDILYTNEQVTKNRRWKKIKEKKHEVKWDKERENKMNQRKNGSKEKSAVRKS